MSTLWRYIDARWVDDDKEFDAYAITMQSDGTAYTVVVSGPKGMDAGQFVPAMNAALAATIGALGGDMSSVGAKPLDTTLFGDTSKRVQ